MRERYARNTSLSYISKNFDDALEAWPLLHVYLSALVYKLVYAGVSTCLERLLLLNLRLDVDGVEAVVGYLSRHDLPQQRSEREDINFIVILALLEKLRRHIGRGTRKLHRALAKVSLKSIFI